MTQQLQVRPVHKKTASEKTPGTVTPVDDSVLIVNGTSIDVKPVHAIGYLVIGAVFGWLTSYTLMVSKHGLTEAFPATALIKLLGYGIFFALAVGCWGFGKAAGAQWRAGDSRLAVRCMLPVIVGMTAGTAALYSTAGHADVFFPLLASIGMMLSGCLLERAGFG